MKKKDRFDREQDNSYRSGTDKVYPMKFDSVMPTPLINRGEIEKATKDFSSAGKGATVITAKDISDQPIKSVPPFSFRKKKGWSGGSPKTFY